MEKENIMTSIWSKFKIGPHQQQVIIEEITTQQLQYLAKGQEPPESLLLNLTLMSAMLPLVKEDKFVN